MNILDVVKETGLEPNWKAATHGGEYCSPCPFCKEGDDRFLVWPQRHNKNGEYQGGRFSCRVCGKYGDAITFLRLLYDMTYPEACARLRIEPKERSNTIWKKPIPKLPIAEDPPKLWIKKAMVFVDWSHTQLMNNPTSLSQFIQRGFTMESIQRFKLGYCPRFIKRERVDWGLSELKEGGTSKDFWIISGLIVPTFSSDGRVIKIKTRSLSWKEGSKYQKYKETEGSKKCFSIYGNTSLPCVIILESELDSLLIQQEAADLAFCVALGGSTKPIDAETDRLLRKTKTVLFLPDFDKAGKIAWDKWKKMFPNIHRILTPHEKSAGDYFIAGGNLRQWLENEINEINQ